jgi:hypothetical protein
MNINEIDKLTDISTFEKIKLKMDCERIRISERRMQLTLATIFIPLILAAITLGFSVYLENEKAKNNFEIKAVEIVMNASSPKAAQHKAMVLFALFPDRLPENFKDKMLDLYPE